MTTTRQRPDLGDDDLLAQCRRGDDVAWAQLLDRYERLVYSVPLGYGLSRHDAADVAQATFAELVRSLDAIQDAAALGAWLATVARRTTWRQIARRRNLDERDLDTVVGDDVDPWHEWIDTWTDRHWVVEGLLALGGPCRDLLVGLYLDPDEPSYADLAARLGRPVGSIGPTRGRCLDKLRLVLGELDEHA